MTGPRFVPCSYALDRGQFGKASTIGWRKPTNRVEHQLLLAAQIRHEYTARIHAQLRAQKMTILTYAEKVQMSYGRTTKLLRGEIVMRLEDIASAQLTLGGILKASSANK